MGMSANNRGGKVTPTMNVTPLVDVVLVLLIIFMVITPLLSKQFYVHIPKQEKKEAEAKPNPADQPLVMSVNDTGNILLNGTTVEDKNVVEKLKRIFAARNDHVLFFDASDKAPYGKSVQALDMARAGGAVTIAILTERPKGAN